MKFIKKHKNKLFILMLTIISALTLFLNVGKTYAYESEQFSYTIDNVSKYNNGSLWQYDNTTHIISSNVTSNESGILLLKLDFNNSTTINKYLLLNLTIEYSQDNINFNYYSNYTLPSITYLYRDSGLYSIDRIAQGRLTFSNYNSYNNMYTLILSPNNATQSNESNYNSLYLNLIAWASQGYYRITLNNIDYVATYDLGISYYYDTYYGQIEDNYNQLQEDYSALQELYNDLDTEYSDLQNAYGDLEENYNTLEDDYNTLEEQKKEIENSYISNIYPNMHIYIDDTRYNFDYLTNNNVISQQRININRLLEITNNSNPNSNLIIKIYLGKNINWTDIDLYLYNFEYASNFDILYYWYDTSTNPVEEYEGEFGMNIYNNPYNLNYDLITTKLLRDYNNTLTYGTIDTTQVIGYQFNVQTNFNTDVYIDLNNMNAQSYNIGYQKANEDAEKKYQNIINTQASTINTLNNTITQKNVTIVALQEQIASQTSDYNLNNLMWTIASTPFESFKQIWNVNFLGVNITQMVTGLLTAFIVLYIVKKFFL